MTRVAATAMFAAMLLAGCGSGGGEDEACLSRGEELNGWIIEVVTEGGVVSRHVASNPDRADSNSDGVSDCEKYIFGLDPNSVDTDGDGLTDCQEIIHSVADECADPSFAGPYDGGTRTEVRNWDTDSDGLADGLEVNGFWIELPRGAQRYVTTNATTSDTDGDGIRDGDERNRFGTDPGVPDTDGDGCEDGLDPLPRFREEYHIGLQSFRWFEEGRSGSIEIGIIMLLADASFTVPDSSQEAFPPGMTIQHDHNVDLGGIDTPAVRPPTCTFSPYSPWVRVDMQVAEMDGNAVLGPLDIHSETVPNGKISIWWNVQDDIFRWNVADTAAVDMDPLTWRGADAEITFRPLVLGSE